MKYFAIAFTIICVSSVCSKDCVQVYFHIDLVNIDVRPSEREVHPAYSTRTPGSGACLREWERIRETREDVYEIQGVLINDNSGFPIEGANVLIGNLEVSERLRLLTQSDEYGRFTVTVNNQTFEKLREEAKNSELPLIYMKPREGIKTSEEIYKERRYLYFGKSGVDLYQYRIPYEKAEQSSADN